MSASLVIAARKSAEGLVGHDVSTGWSMRGEIHAGCKPIDLVGPANFSGEFARIDQPVSRSDDNGELNHQAPTHSPFRFSSIWQS